MCNIKPAFHGVMWIALAQLKSKTSILYLHLQHSFFLVIILLLSFHPCHPSIDWSINTLIAICDVLKWKFQDKRTKHCYSGLGSLLHLLSAAFDTTSTVLHVQLGRTSTVMFLADTSEDFFEHNFWHFLPMCSRLLYQYFLSFYSELKWIPVYLHAWYK